MGIGGTITPRPALKEALVQRPLIVTLQVPRPLSWDLPAMFPRPWAHKPGLSPGTSSNRLPWLFSFIFFKRQWMDLFSLFLMQDFEHAQR